MRREIPIFQYYHAGKVAIGGRGHNNLVNLVVFESHAPKNNIE